MCSIYFKHIIVIVNPSCINFCGTILKSFAIWHKMVKYQYNLCEFELAIVKLRKCYKYPAEFYIYMERERERERERELQCKPNNQSKASSKNSRIEFCTINSSQLTFMYYKLFPILDNNSV